MVLFLLTILGLSLFEGILLLVSYIANNVFPQPLSQKEEQECLEKMKKGDLKARNILIEHNLRLVAHIVKKFENTREETEDLISIGTIGLIKAIQTFDNKKNTRLATYAARCIENEILMHLRSIKKLQGEMLIHEPVGSDKEGNEITLMDILGTEPDMICNRVQLNLDEEKLYDLLKELDYRERVVIIMRYGLKDGERYTQREIAKRLGISRSYVSRIEKKAVQKLVKKFKKEG
ncbi:sporulation sigma factor SigK [Anoxybacter fermentans]|uniref:RNA polymerase sigma factor n=1 Tax=Anoxybacter fermentans TaxID=1323375 RepID=A0A3Q9HR09_9FIRM|nr:RNA polymerase sporulation sigma factor SigK [Anoxybacter fermentans]AZR73618.1 sporulation sigma factor SigK [Anoxybacter fermentans]